MAATGPSAAAAVIMPAGSTMAPATGAHAAADSAPTGPADLKVHIDRQWENAIKLRAAIEKELVRKTKIIDDKKSGQNVNRNKKAEQDIDKNKKPEQDADAVLAGFEKAEDQLARYRYLCLEIIMADIRTAKGKDVEEHLWNTHVSVTKAYRHVLGGLQGSNLPVLKRKVEKQYVGFLMTSLSFYRTYLKLFCSAYKFRGLERVSRKVKFDDLPGAVAAPVQDAEPEVLKFVHASYHMTLVILGDLSRYRALVRSKDRSFDTALSYYALANELMPESGFGYHQAAVIYLETKNHLEVIYNLYRAATCDSPHPLAITNLRAEFKALRRGVVGVGAKGSVEAMINWFAKLHAVYYMGEPFSESARKELEDELDNRLAMSLKTCNEDGIDKILLKMVLINISAYVAGLSAIKEEWTAAKSETCQYVLQLNTRTIYTISRLLSEELEDIVEQNASQADGTSSSKFTPAFCRMLPLFRVYMTWLCFYASDLNQFREYLEPQFARMCKSLANSLTRLLGLLREMSATSVTWLFPEDEETNGMDCLNGPALYEGCQLRVDALQRKSKPPADEVPSTKRTVENASYVRVFDSILCGLRLSEHPSFPIALRGSEKFFYVEGTKQPTGFPDSSTAAPEATEAAPASAPVPAVSMEARSITVPKEPAVSTESPTTAVLVPPGITDSEDFSEDDDFYRPARNTSRRGDLQPTVTAVAAPTAPRSEFPLENQLGSILEDFLSPPERTASQNEPHQGGSQGSRRPSGFPGYDSTSPTPGSAGSKTFPSLPWSYFVPTAPTDSTLCKPGTVRSPSGVWGPQPTSSDSPTNAQFNSRVKDLFESSSPGYTGQNLRRSDWGSSPFIPQALQDWTLQEQQALVAQNSKLAWSATTSASGLHSRKSSSLASPLVRPQQEASRSPAITQNLGFPSTHFSGDSSLLTVNSPYGLPKAQMHAYGYQGMSAGATSSQESSGFPGGLSFMRNASGYSPGPPPGFPAQQGHGNAYELTTTVHDDNNNNSRGFSTQGSYGQNSYDVTAGRNIWSTTYGPRSGSDVTGYPPTTQTATNNRVVPMMSGTSRRTSSKGVSTDWTGQSQPK